MRGKKAKALRKLRERDVSYALQAAQHNYVAARALERSLLSLALEHFWTQVAVAALCRFVEKYAGEGAFADLEKAVHCWPTGVEI